MSPVRAPIEHTDIDLWLDRAFREALEGIICDIETCSRLAEWEVSYRCCPEARAVLCLTCGDRLQSEIAEIARQSVYIVHGVCHRILPLSDIHWTRI